jgi:Fur family transcriptional regulator, peroxide stress response regulator
MAVDAMLDLLRAKGLKITPQRVEILSYLDGNKKHPSARAIYDDLQPRFSNLSFATVYNTLEALVAAGLVREIVVKEKSYFDPDISNHDHAYCLRCGRVFDLALAKRDFKLPPGFVPHSVSCLVYGVCADCKDSSG